MSENKNTQSQGCGYDDRFETESETNLSDSNNCSSHDSPRDRSSTKSTSQRSSFADLRNQVTIVSPGMQTAVNAEYHSEKPSAPQKDDSLELPFTAGNFQADELLARGGMSITYLGHKCDDPAAMETLAFNSKTPLGNLVMMLIHLRNKDERQAIMAAKEAKALAEK